jgi:hypothetical protein
MLKVRCSQSADTYLAIIISCVSIFGMFDYAYAS